MEGKTFRILVMEIVGPCIQYIRFLLRRLNGYSGISKDCILESGIHLDKVYPASILIGANTLVAANVTILCHEHILREKDNPDLSLCKPVSIGERCFIGVGALILPGVTIGNDCVIGSGSVVTKAIPAGCIAAGNPARIIKEGIQMNDDAMIKEESL